VIKVGGFLVVVHLAGGVALAAPPLPVVVQIQSVTHDARTPLSAGKHVTVRLVGTPGGVARFHLAGVAVGMGMREMPSSGQQSATYIGTYVIRPGDAAAVAAITATLKMGEQELTKAGDRPVIIDARPPKVTNRLPEPDARLANLRPNIVVRFYDGESSIDPTRVRLVINGQDVTNRTAVTKAFAAYTPGGPFRPGPVRVQAVVPDRAGNATRVDWTFVVTPPRGLIDSVTVSPAAGLKPGDYLTVVMAGAPGGRASLTTTGSPRSIVMLESAEALGRYVGLHPITPSDQGRLIIVSTQLRRGNRSSTASAVAAVPVLGRSPRPTVVSTSGLVVTGEQAIEQLTVRGSAGPAFHLEGLVSARVESPTGSSVSPLVAASTSARQDGAWRLSFGPFVPWPRAALILTVVAIDPLGQRSLPVTVALGGVPVAPREAVVAVTDAAQTATQDVAPATGETRQETQETSPTDQQVSAPPPAPVPSAGPAPCPSGRVDETTGQCVVTEPGPQDSAAGGGSGGESYTGNSPPADPPSHLDPEPPEDPNPDPPKGSKPKP